MSLSYTSPTASIAPAEEMLDMAACRAHYIELVRQDSEDILARGDRFSRACDACGCEKERVQRVICTACARAVCKVCADESAHFCEPDTETSGPSTFVPLYGDEDHSRECGLCYAEQPRERAFFTGCGHLMCTACLLMMDQSSFAAKLPIACPFCRKTSRVLALVEEFAEETLSKPEITAESKPEPVDQAPTVVPVSVETQPLRRSSRKRKQIDYNESTKRPRTH